MQIRSGLRNSLDPDPDIVIADAKHWPKQYNFYVVFQIYLFHHQNTHFTQKVSNSKFFTPLCCCCFWFRDPRSGFRDPGWVKIRIRDKHPGSATLVVNPLRKKLIRIPHVVKLNGHEQEGLTAASRLDPAERERAEISQWLNHCIDTLNIQVYNL
jgi:hypothetical protein